MTSSFAPARRVVGLALALLSCGPDPGHPGPTSASPTARSSGPTTLGRAVLVRVARLRRGPIRTFVDVTTDIRARRRVQVFSKVGGAYVREILRDEGDEVKAGDVLLRLDDADFRIEVKRRESQLAQAELAEVQADTSLKEALARDRAEKAKLERARADYERAAAAMKGGVEVFSEKEITDLQKAFETAQAEYEAVRLAVEQARSALELATLERKAAEVELEKARYDLDQTQVRSPIDGIVQERLVDEGLLVSSQTHLFTIVDRSDLVAFLRVPQEDLAAAGRVGLGVEFRFDALPGRVFHGAVEAVNPAIDPSSGLAKIRVALDPAAAEAVRPGMFARARIVVSDRRDAWLLPKRAIVREAGSDAFFAVEEGRARRHAFTAGASTDREVEILSLDGVDLSGSDDAASRLETLEVVVVGQDRLRDGDAVEIADAETSDS